MKKTILTFALASLASMPLFAQKTGDSVTPEVLGKIEWIRGSAPEAWEPGKVYILECWATWCGPCIFAIPHIDAFHDKYFDRGLRVIGVNVWEDGKDKVAEFVEKKGDGMSYDIAYTGKGGAFETEWLKPAGVTGIPRAFVVKDGKVVLSTHPARLNESVVEALLEGGEAQEKALSSIAEAEARQRKTNEILQAIRDAEGKKDAATMEAKIAELKEFDPENRSIVSLERDLLIAKSDWSALENTLKGIENETERAVAGFSLSRKIIAAEDAPAHLRTLVADNLEALISRGGGPAEWESLARLRWGAGDKDKAVAAADKAAELVKGERFVQAGVPAAPYERFAAALKDGEIPDSATLAAWIKEAREQKK